MEDWEVRVWNGLEFSTISPASVIVGLRVSVGINIFKTVECNWSRTVFVSLCTLVHTCAFCATLCSYACIYNLGRY